MNFKLMSDYEPRGDQPEAIEQLSRGIEAGEKHQVLLGVTGSGKTFTMAKLIERANRPALVDLMEDVLRMQRWYFDPANHVEAQQIAAKITHQPIESLNWVFTKGDFYRSPNGNPDLKTVATDLKMEKELGFLKSDIDVAKYADLSIVDEASKRLGKLKEE